jgi:hypothetical protein
MGNVDAADPANTGNDFVSYQRYQPTHDPKGPTIPPKQIIRSIQPNPILPSNSPIDVNTGFGRPLRQYTSIIYRGGRGAAGMGPRQDR